MNTSARGAGDALPRPEFLIDGHWRTGSGDVASDIVDPGTGAVLASYRSPSKAELDEVLASAARAYPPWRATPAYARGVVLRKAAALMRERVEVIATVLTTEEGKPLVESRGEVLGTAEMFEWYAEEGLRAYGRIVPPRVADLRQMVVREPVGPVAAFSAWNFPARNPGFKIAAALAAGCTCIIKPAEETPLTCILLAHALIDAGLPAGVLNVVYGDAPSISKQLIASPVVRKISLTGSTRVGKALAHLAADGVKKLTLELGGHAPVIVFDDADLELAVRLTVPAKFRNAGQQCISPTRFFVQQDRYQEFIALFAAATAGLRLGNGLDPATQIGPLVNRKRYAEIESFVEDAHGKNARVLSGSRGSADGNGFFFPPTIISDIPDEARMMQQEPFGPVAAIAPFATLDEVIGRANSLPFGLAAYAFTRSLRTANVIADALENGMVGINTVKLSYPETPFGGVKESGYGGEGGIEGLDAYLVTKSISMAY